MDKTEVYLMPPYSAASKLLHWLALNFPTLLELSFDVEKKLFLKSSSDSRAERHVFVCGLARAGTTILMRQIYQSNQFSSLTYNDMPFVMSPNAWAKITRRFSRQSYSKERAHGDRIFVDYKSPEALDEVFWRTFCNSDYIFENFLAPHKPDKETLLLYAEYISLISRSKNKSRYLSKNNNNILRLPELSSFFQNSIFLIPIRSPREHAVSLLNQHQRFSGIDSFSLSYLKWLGHHEFGAGHRPFVFSSGKRKYTDSTKLEYWIDLWIECYRYLRSIQSANPHNLFFIPYESLCESENVWKRLTEIIDINCSDTTYFKLDKIQTTSQALEHSNMKIANDLYIDIKQESLDKLFS